MFGTIASIFDESGVYYFVVYSQNATGIFLLIMLFIHTCILPRRRHTSPSQRVEPRYHHEQIRKSVWIWAALRGSSALCFSQYPSPMSSKRERERSTSPEEERQHKQRRVLSPLPSLDIALGIKRTGPKANGKVNMLLLSDFDRFLP
jgi:hypothetical protein